MGYGGRLPRGWRSDTALTIDRTYGGDSLGADSYSWRAMVIDYLGAASAWAYGTLTLTADYDAPDPDVDNAGFGRRCWAPASSCGRWVRSRGPGALRAVIEDAANIGASAYVSAPGELLLHAPRDPSTGR